jgi:hypothetical protein
MYVHFEAILLQDTQEQGKGTLRQFSRKQRFIVPAQTQQTHVQRLNSKNKGALPYILLQAGYKSKKQSLTHTWLPATLLATSPPSAM